MSLQYCYDRMMTVSSSVLDIDFKTEEQIKNTYSYGRIIHILILISLINLTATTFRVPTPPLLTTTTRPTASPSPAYAHLKFKKSRYIFSKNTFPF